MYSYHQPVAITKADGTTEQFDVEKLIASLKRAGAKDDSITEVVNAIERKLAPGISTAAIYREAFSILKKIEHPVASRYSLKRALLDFGPTGYPFEDYVAEIFKAEGWDASTRHILTGKCTTHEVDVVAEKKGKRIGAEVKFHNQAGLRTDVKTALYVHARWHDLNEAAKAKGEKEFSEWYLVTNTHFTSQAIEYALCAGLSLIGWDYPRGEGLQDRIEQHRLHPLTCLTTLSKGEKDRMMVERVVLCKSIADHPDTLAKFGVPERKLKNIMAESKYLCTP